MKPEPDEAPIYMEFDGETFTLRDADEWAAEVLAQQEET